MKQSYDYLIVGAGLYGAVCAHELTKKGHRCLVIDSRKTIGGNCATDKIHGIDVHLYGPHIFHTSDQQVWEFVNKFTTFNNYRHSVVANFHGKYYTLPINLRSYYEVYGTANLKTYFNPDATGDDLKTYGENLLGKPMYDILIKEYSEKQWGRKDSLIPASMLKRINKKMTWNSTYFDDKYEGIPVDGYSTMISRMLEGVEVRLNTNYWVLPREIKETAGKIIWTGPIDEYFSYKFGKLEYKSCTFDHQIKDTEDFQGISQMNYTSKDVDYTRIVEHKHFNWVNTDKTVITYEYPNSGTLKLYPIRDKTNHSMYERYKQEAATLKNVHFGGRLGEYRYYDMDQTIKSALNYVSR